MKDLPLVTIVTPAYNQAEYLTETIESVLGQDYPNVEYIVLDDGSTDETPDVLKKFEGRVRYERHANMGQARTLNRGWSIAKGPIVGYLSSDDRLRSDAISRLVQALQAHPEIIVAYGDFSLIDAAGTPLRTVHTEDFDQRRLTVDLVCQPGAGALFRRDVFEQLGGWNRDLKQVPDFEFWLRASRLGSFVRVPHVLADYRIHEGSASFQNMTMARANEIVHVVRQFWSSSTDTDARRSVSMAHVIASKNHAQSGRSYEALKNALSAVSYWPATTLSVFYWRALLSGTFRRIFYRLQSTVRAGGNRIGQRQS